MRLLLTRKWKCQKMSKNNDVTHRFHLLTSMLTLSKLFCNFILSIDQWNLYKRTKYYAFYGFFFSLKKLHFHDIWYPSNLLDYEKQKLELQQFQLTFDSLRQAQSLGLVWNRSFFSISPWNISSNQLQFWIFREINCKCKVRSWNDEIYSLYFYENFVKATFLQRVDLTKYV